MKTRPPFLNFVLILTVLVINSCAPIYYTPTENLTTNESLDKAIEDKKRIRITWANEKEQLFSELYKNSEGMYFGKIKPKSQFILLDPQLIKQILLLNEEAAKRNNVAVIMTSSGIVLLALIVLYQITHVDVM